MHLTEIAEGGHKKNGEEEIFKVIMAKNFPKLVTDPQPTNSKSSDNTKQDKYN